MAKGRSGGSFRSAISGRFVTAKHGKASPRTTVFERSDGKRSPNTTIKDS